MHIGSQLIDVDSEREKDLNPSVGLDAIWPPQFPNAQAEMEWRRDCQHAIDSQAHAWAVAPRVEMRAKSGLLLSAGAEVVPGRDFTFGQIHTLYRRGVLLRGTPEGARVAACPPDARYVVSANQAISSLEGQQLLAGAEVRSEWLDGGEQALLALVHRGVVVDRQRPALSRQPADVALREREADLERAKKDVDAAVEALTADDNVETQKHYVDKKLQLDLAGVRVEAARKAVEAATAAEAERQRLDLAQKVVALEAQIKACDDETSKFRKAELKAALQLADALHATHAHEDATYQLRIMRNARFAELYGGEMRQENPPGHRLYQQIGALARIVDIDPKHLNGKKT